MIGLKIITSAVNNSMQTMVCPWTVDEKSWYALSNAQTDSAFLELYCIPDSNAQIPDSTRKNYRIPDSTSKNFQDPESGLFYRRRSVLKITLIVLTYVSRLEFFNTKELETKQKESNEKLQQDLHHLGFKGIVTFGS